MSSRKHDDKKKHEGKGREKEKSDNKVVSEKRVSRDELVTALEGLLGELRTGALSLTDENRELKLTLPEELKLRHKARLNDKEAKYSLKISWPLQSEQE
jgi:amphi-Trp domain-containing protein